MIIIYFTYKHNRIQSISLDIAELFNSGQSRAVEVEECSCPEGYRGLSCENCAVGFTRNSQELYLGTCEPCTCNGHSSHCDPDTGICIVSNFKLCSVCF